MCDQRRENNLPIRRATTACPRGWHARMTPTPEVRSHEPVVERRDTNEGGYNDNDASTLNIYTNH